MRKAYTTALALAAFSAAMAQKPSVPASQVLPGAGLSKTHDPATIPANVHPTSATDLFGYERAAFWTEDFSGGAIPAGWTNIDDLTPSGDPNVTFVWSNDPAAVGVAALGYTPSAVFNAAGAGDGYVWCNSDRGLSAAPASDHHTVLTTTAIDCSAQTSVLLTMESLIGVFDYDAATNVKVRVSTDMSTWTDFIPFPCLVTGAAAPPCVRWSANPQGIGLNITSVAAGQATVYLQFEWLGGWEYFWAIDNIQLSTVPDYERILDFAYLSHCGGGNEFGRVPIAQLGTDYILGGQVRNFGANDQTNMVMQLDVTGPGGGVVFSATSNIGTLAAGDTAYVEEFVTLPGGLIEGIYTVNAYVTSDQDASENDPSDDTVDRTFALDNTTYGLDGIGVHLGTPSLTAIGTASFTDGEDGLYCLTYYPIKTDMTVYGLEVLLSASTVPGAEIVANLHDSTEVIANDNVLAPLEESGIHVVTAWEVAAGRAGIAFSSPVTLTPGAYYAGVTLYSGGGTSDVAVIDDNTVAQPNISSCIYITAVTPPTVYSNGNAFTVRLSADASIGMTENQELTGVSLYPNPATTTVTIGVTEAGSYTVEFMDALGRTVRTDRMTATSDFDVADLAKGAYTVRVTSEKASAVYPVVLK